MLVGRVGSVLDGRARGQSQMEQDGSDYHAWSSSGAEVDPQLTQVKKVPLDYPPCSQMMADPLAVNNDLAIAIQTFWH